MGVRGGDQVGVSVDVLAGVEGAKGVGAAVFSWMAGGVILSTRVAVIVTGPSVGVASKARNPLEIGDQKKMIENRAARIVSEKKEMNTQKPEPRRPPLRGFEDGGSGGKEFSAGGTS